MERHLEILGLAVGHADLGLIPVAARWIDEDTQNHGRGPKEGDRLLAKARAAAPGLASDLSNALAWLARHQAAA